MAQLERFAARNVKFFLSLSLSLSSFRSLCLACKSVLCSSDVSILFLSSALASVKEKGEEEEEEEDASFYVSEREREEQEV